MQNYSHLPHASKTLFQSALVTVGATRCPEQHPDFHDPGPIQQHVFYLGGSSVQVTQAGRQAFLASSASVSFHNRGDLVKRGRGTGQGDYSNWFAPQPELLFQVLGNLQQDVNWDERRPFLMQTGPCSPSNYLAQKQLIDELQNPIALDPLQVEERALRLLKGVLACAHRTTSAALHDKPSTRRRHAQIVEHSKWVLSRTFTETLSLTSLGKEVGASAFHLARLFRAHTGWSLHSYRTQMRLNLALERLWEGETNLTQLALELGFSSHSHMSCSFKRAFGRSPSALRAHRRISRLRT